MEQYVEVCTTQAFYDKNNFCGIEEAYNNVPEFKEKCDRGDICRQCEAGTDQTGNATVSDDWWRCDNGACIEKIDQKYNQSIFIDGNRQVWTLTHSLQISVP